MNAAPQSQFPGLTDEVEQAVGPMLALPPGDMPVPVSLKPTEAGAVFHTTDYDIFNHIASNREIIPAQVRKLVKKIKHRNLLHLRPMDVTTSFGIVDGQHRLEAARELGVPIYYRMAEELSKDDIAELNSSTKNWTGSDYLNYWTVEGLDAYKALSRFLNQHPRIKLTTAKMIARDGESTTPEEFQEGRYRVGNMAKANEAATFAERIADEAGFKWAFNPLFVMALYKCVTEVDGFDQNQLMHKIEVQPRSLVRCVTMVSYLEMLEEIYNYNTKSEARRLRFRP